jgi:hypothetical protein
LVRFLVCNLLIGSDLRQDSLNASLLGPTDVVLPRVGPSVSGLAVQPLLEEFLLRTPLLEHLRVNFQTIDVDSSTYILERFSMANNLLPNLQRLEFGMIATTPDLLLQAISKFSPTLKHVGFWKVTLHHSVLPCWIDNHGRFYPWLRLFKELSRMPHLRLESLTVGCLVQQDRSFNQMRIGFSNGKMSQEYAGDMKTFLSQLIDDLRVRWPADQLGSSDSHGNEDNEMEDDDEDVDDENEGEESE